MTTEILSLPELTSAQYGKFVTYNANLRKQEGLGFRVLSQTNGGPPGSPAAGDVYIVDVASGAWSTFTVKNIAHYYAGAWTQYTRFEGIQLWVNDTNKFVVYDGSNWVELAATSTGVAAFTTGSVPFVASGALAQDNASLNFNDSTNVLTAANVTVTNNLIVNGTLSTINTTNLDVTDAIITLAKGNVGTSIDSGFIMERGTTNVAFVWDESADEFVTVSTSSNGTVTQAVITDYFNIHSGAVIADDNITAGGTVQGTRLISTVASGTAPFTVASTTNVANLNASSLNGATHAAPGPIGGGTPSTIACTTLSANTAGNIVSYSDNFANNSFTFTNINTGTSAVNQVAFGNSSSNGIFLMSVNGGNFTGAPNDVCFNLQISASICFKTNSTAALTISPTQAVTVTGAFGCNTKAAQGAVAVNAAATDLATVIALTNQLRAALIANGICS